MTCSHSSCVPKARTPRMCVTVLASQPSVSMETETTQRTCSPSLPGLPTVFSTSRIRSSSVSSSASRPGKRCAVLGLELLDLGGGELLELGAHALAGLELLAVHEDRVRAGCSQRLSSTLLKSGERCRGRRPARRRGGRAGLVPAIQSKTSLLTLVLLQTTMNTGGVRPSAARLGVLPPTARYCFS